MSDAVARYKRAMGYDVFFCTGTDEHGQKIENLAKEAGKTPKEYVDAVAGQIKDIWALLGSSHDYFVRTTDENHVREVQKIFTRLYRSGIYTRAITRAGTAPPANHFSPTRRLRTANAPTADVKRVKREKRLISSE